MLKRISLSIIVLLLTANLFASEPADEKTYISANLLGIPMGIYQLSAEVGIGDNRGVYVEGMYMNYQMGLLPKVFGGFLDIISYEEDFSYTELMESFNIYGGGGSLGVVNYIPTKGSFKPYWSAAASYYKLVFSMNPDIFTDGYSGLSTVILPIHSMALSASLGGKIPLGSFLSLDVFFMLGLTGAFVDYNALINSLNLAEYADIFKAAFISAGDITVSASSGLGFRVCLVL